ncbi:hypothetical protein TNIN_203621 [Trichonephila inaurata madagascariensis]|uniref:Uncharacterized protein n=1 Tax=Trichonephila inaurata madagascariensis TaxID=2747483 RepID=A0A8X6WNY9_9ARAC|nr:hypothetical protein TNIN_203621 [Trichonephila inaurata madagascariensis]
MRILYTDKIISWLPKIALTSEHFSLPLPITLHFLRHHVGINPFITNVPPYFVMDGELGKGDLYNMSQPFPGETPLCVPPGASTCKARALGHRPSVTRSLILLDTL